MSAGQSRHVDGDVADGVRRRRHDPGRRHRLRPGRRRVPDAVAGADDRGRSACSSPARTGCPKASFNYKTRVHEHRGPHGVPRPVAVRDARPRGAARHRRAPDGHRPGRAAPRNLLRRDELPYANPNGMPYDHIAPVETFEQAVEDARLRGLPQGAGATRWPRAATSASASRPTSSRPRAATGHLGHRGGDDPHRADRARSTSTSPAARRGNSLETTVVQLTADALGADIEDVATIQGDTAVTPFGAGTAGSRSGSMTAGAVSEAAAMLRERIVAIAAHRLEASPRTTSSWPARRPVVRDDPSKSVTLRRDRLPLAYYEPRSCRRGWRPALEATARFTVADDDPLGQRHARVHVRGRRRDRPGHADCATSSARTAAR